MTEVFAYILLAACAVWAVLAATLTVGERVLWRGPVAAWMDEGAEAPATGEDDGRRNDRK